MKHGNKYYLEMPRGLIFGYDLSAGALRLYYLLKEKEQRFWEEGKDTFFSKDTELIEDLQDLHK